MFVCVNINMCNCVSLQVLVCILINIGSVFSFFKAVCACGCVYRIVGLWGLCVFLYKLASVGMYVCFVFCLLYVCILCG